MAKLRWIAVTLLILASAAWLLRAVDVELSSASRHSALPAALFLFMGASGDERAQIKAQLESENLYVWGNDSVAFNESQRAFVDELDRYLQGAYGDDLASLAASERTELRDFVYQRIHVGASALQAVNLDDLRRETSAAGTKASATRLMSELRRSQFVRGQLYRWGGLNKTVAYSVGLEKDGSRRVFLVSTSDAAEKTHFLSKLKGPLGLLLLSLAALAILVTKVSLGQRLASSIQQDKADELRGAVESQTHALADSNLALEKSVQESQQSAARLERQLQLIESITEQIANESRDTNNAIGMSKVSGDGVLTSSQSMAQSMSSIAGAASQSREEVQAAVGAMEQNTDAMHAIEAATNEMAGALLAVAEFSRQIRVLALNASIEASHAGEVGNGFAVVAEQVRDLAIRSDGTTKQIQELMKSSNARVREGLAVSAQTRDALAEILKMTDSINNRLLQTTEALDGQEHRVTELTSSLDTIAAASDRTLSAVERLLAESHKS